MAVADFAQAIVERVTAGRQLQFGAHQVHGMARTLQRACDEGEARGGLAVAHKQAGENTAGMRALPSPEFVERRVDAALQAAFDVPVGLAVADVIDGRHTLLRVIARLDPAIHLRKKFFKMMDARVKPAHDGSNYSLLSELLSEISGASGRFMPTT